METQTIYNLPEKRKLLLLVLTRILFSYLIMGFLLFFPAGDLHYYNGWLLLIAFFIPMLFLLIYFFIKDPLMLEKRMRIREKQKKQKTFVILSIFLFIITFTIPGLDYRYKWSNVPGWLVTASVILLEAGYIMFFIVLKQNSFASRVIEIQEGQKVIDSGLYSFVRHPMYLAAIIIYLSIPFILSSYYSLIPVIFLPFILSYRINNEEKILIEGLEGYLDYMKKVKYRLLPYIW